MTPEQRERKQQADRERRARLKAQGLDAKAIRAGVSAAMKKPRPAQKAPAERTPKKGDLYRDLRKIDKAAPLPIPVTAKEVAPTRHRDRGYPSVSTMRKAHAVATHERMQVISFKGHAHHAEKLQRLGGGSWIRAAIEAAKG